GRLPPWDGITRGLLKAGEDLVRLDPHGLGHPAAVRNQPGDDRDRMSAGTRKQGGAQPIETLGDGCEVEAQANARLDHHQSIARREMIEPVPQRADRLRRVIAVGARRLEVPGWLERCANLGHTHLDANAGAEMYHCREAGPTHAGAPLCGCGRNGVRPRRLTGPAEASREAAAVLDLGTSFLASVARDPDALAIVDGDVRLTYSAWYERISALVSGFDALGLEAGDHLVTVLQNRWQAATIHWACQFAGIIVTPLNWRFT